jgi:hypothetical protein
MRAWLVLVRREIHEKRSLLLAASGAGLAVVVVQLTGLELQIRDGISAGLLMAFPFAIAIGAGASAISSDVHERRLGFYFSRPVSGVSIGAAKLFAAMALPLLATALASACAAAAYPDALAIGNVLMAFATVPVVLGTHLLVSWYRSASRLLFLDLACASALVLGFAGGGSFMLEAGAERAALQALPGLAALVVSCLIVASVVQVAAGRTDPSRSHIALSASLWPMLGLVAGATAVIVSWMLAVSPSEVYDADLGLPAAPTGDLVLVAGDGNGRAGFAPDFLLDARSGAFQQLRFPGGWSGPWTRDYVTYAADGTPLWLEWMEVASQPALGWLVRLWDEDVWFDLERRSAAHTIVVARSGLGAPTRIPLEDRLRLGDGEELGITSVTPRASKVLLSRYPDRTLLAIDATSGRLISSLKVSEGSSWATFVNDDVVRVYQESPQAHAPRLTVSEWNPQTGSLLERLRLDAEWREVRPDWRRLTTRVRTWLGERVLVVDERRARYLVYDLGSPQRPVLSAPFAPPNVVALLRDGSLASVQLAHSGWVLEKATAGDWDPTRHRLDLEPGLKVRRLIELPRGRLLLSAIGAGGQFTLFCVAEDGTIAWREEGLTPGSEWSWPGLGRHVQHQWPRFFSDQEGALVEFDPETRRRRVLITPSQ